MYRYNKKDKEEIMRWVSLALLVIVVVLYMRSSPPTAAATGTPQGVLNVPALPANATLQNDTSTSSNAAPLDADTRIHSQLLPTI